MLMWTALYAVPPPHVQEPLVGEGRLIIETS
jgi:hypothetical protein